MKFMSMSGKPERIASTSGHVIMVPPDSFVELLPHMEAEARAVGCISEDIYQKITAGNQAPPPNQAPPDRNTIILDKLREMVASNDASFFTKAGFPNKRILDNLCRFATTPEEIKAGWDVVTAEQADAAKAREEAELAAKVNAEKESDGIDDSKPKKDEV